MSRFLPLRNLAEMSTVGNVSQTHSDYAIHSR